MPKILDARAAALEIRGKMEQPSAQDRHITAFVEKVLDQLGMEHTIVNASMVVHALHDADIQPHQIVEYPKAIVFELVDEAKYGDDHKHKETFIADDEDAEHELRMKYDPPADLAPVDEPEDAGPDTLGERPVPDDVDPLPAEPPAPPPPNPPTARPGPRPAPKRA